MPEVQRIRTDKLSGYRTSHLFKHYGEFTTPEHYAGYLQWARANRLPVFILGNGSNTLFTKKNVRSLVLVNRLPAQIRFIDETRLEASSSVEVMQILKHCEEKNLHSFYFLASVPATVGGAVAMNAGLGGGGTIFDFVESVTFMEDGQIKTLGAAQIPRAHRTTPFAGVQDKLILSVVFHFPKSETSIKGSIKRRALWSRDFQDRQIPNCGSVFKVCDRPLFRCLSVIPPFGIAIPGFRAQYSRRTLNWIINRNRSSWAIVALIRMAILVHRALGRPIELELVLVG
ncbi:MAG: FAD-binding protein [Rhizobacter sp.]|nr:FAD-binding protein [Rhizobacter sp.]